MSSINIANAVAANGTCSPKQAAYVGPKHGPKNGPKSEGPKHGPKSEGPKHGPKEERPKHGSVPF
jgi:hypothetical protein